jgi:biotin carboxylase
MAGRRPVLAIAYGAGSASAMKLSEPARALCDLVWVVDSEQIDDPKTMLRLLRKLGTTIDVAGLSADEAAEALRPIEPDGIVAYADAQMTLASDLAVRLGLDYHDNAAAERLLDKLTQRRALGDGGLPVPRCVDVPPSPTADDVRALAAAVEFPVVLKPRHGAASRDTVLAGDADELVRALAQPTVGSDSAMVIEEYMVGASPPPSANFDDYLSVESVVVDGTINHLAVTGRMYQVEPFRETGLIIPSDFDPSVTDAVLDLATKAISALGVRTGCFHTEIKVTTNGLRVIEVNGRIGGFVAEVLALAVPGVDFFEISQRVALGEALSFPDVLPTEGVGYVIVEQPPLSARRVEAVEGLDRLAEYPGVSSVFLSRQPGDAVDWRKGSHEYVWSVLGNAPDHKGVLALQQFIAEEVNVTYS